MNTTTVLALCGTLVGLIGGVYGIVRNHRLDSETDGRQSGTILTELGYIRSGVEDIKAEQREQRKINTELYARMTAVEAAAKEAHKRLDSMEGRNNNE